MGVGVGVLERTAKQQKKSIVLKNKNTLSVQVLRNASWKKIEKLFPDTHVYSVNQNFG